MAAVAVIPGSEASRLAQFIGLPRWREFDDLQLVDSVRKGFPLKSAATVVSRVDPEGRFLTAADIIPKSTLSRREKNQGPLSMAESEKVLALAKMLSELIRIYKGDTELAGLFLQRKHPILGGRRPIELATESIAGAELVGQLLARADAGFPV